MSMNSELPWPFQDGGIFGMSNNPYPPDLAADEYFDPFRDEASYSGDHGSLNTAESVRELHCAVDVIFFLTFPATTRNQIHFNWTLSTH